jgi:hypothetical protein
MLHSSHLCPYCECSDLEVLRRGGIDWVLSLFGCRPVRCLACLERFYVHKSVVEYYDDRYGGQRTRGRRHRQEQPS